MYFSFPTADRNSVDWWIKICHLLNIFSSSPWPKVNSYNVTMFQMPSVCNEIIDDIEDLISSQDITPKERYSNKKHVTVRVKKTKIVTFDRVNNGYEAPHSIIPGTQTIYIKTWGCTHNSSDSEYMAGQLASYGYTLTSKLFIDNTSHWEAQQPL